MRRTFSITITIPLLLLVSLTSAAGAGGSIATDQEAIPPVPDMLPHENPDDAMVRSLVPLLRIWDAEVEAQMATVVPEVETGIGPGSALRISHSGSTFLCTANFVWTDDLDRLYLGTAGHCVLPEEKTATHGPDADYDPADTKVQVRVGGCPVSALGAACSVGGDGSWGDLGPLAYAIYTGLGEDFAIIEIPQKLHDQVRNEMPAWGGPESEGTLSAGDSVLHYGHGLVYGEAFATRARAGIGASAGTDDFMAVGFSHPGDSGSAVITGKSGPGALEGANAIGILTHGLGVEGVPITGLFMGTTLDKAKRLVGDHLGLRVWTLPGGAPLAGLDPPANGNTTHQELGPGTVVINHAHDEPTTDTIAYNWTNDWPHARVLLNQHTTAGEARITILDETGRILFDRTTNGNLSEDIPLQDAPRNTWTLRFEYTAHTGTTALRIEQAEPDADTDPGAPSGGGTNGDTSSGEDPPTAKPLPVPFHAPLIALALMGLLTQRGRRRTRDGP